MNLRWLKKLSVVLCVAAVLLVASQAPATFSRPSEPEPAFADHWWVVCNYMHKINNGSAHVTTSPYFEGPFAIQSQANTAAGKHNLSPNYGHPTGSGALAQVVGQDAGVLPRLRWAVCTSTADPKHFMDRPWMAGPFDTEAAFQEAKTNHLAQFPSHTVIAVFGP
jgi:hypothetical protein